MAVRPIQSGDASAVRGIWNTTADALVYPGGMEKFAHRPAGLARVRQYFADWTGRVYVDATDTIHGVLGTKPSPVDEFLTAEEITALFPRPSVSRALFRQVCRELMEDWFSDCSARGVPRCWGKIPVATPVLMREVFDDMAAVNGMEREPYATGLVRLVVTPEQGLLGLTNVV